MMFPQGLQGTVTSGQGHREVATSVYGQVRHEVFQVPLKGAPLVEVYAPDGAEVVSQVRALVACRFAVMFMEPPLLKAGIGWRWKDPDGRPGESGDEDYEPVITACTMNWKLVKGSACIIGADVSIRVYDHPFESEMTARLSFSGPAVMTPTAGVTATEDSTERYYY